MKEDTNMVQIIAGRKGKGKTKYLLDIVNNAVESAQGSLIYLDKTAKHMYELSNKVRLINCSEYPVGSTDGFFGFLYGILCQDHDIETIYLDSFLKLSHLEGEDVKDAVLKLDEIGKKYHLNFVLSMSRDAEELPEEIKEFVTLSL